MGELDMDHDSSSSHRDVTLEYLQRHWEKQRKALGAEMGLATAPTPAFTVALSREAGTQGTAVARELGSRLGWPVYDHELLERIAQEMGVRTALLESVDEKRMSWLLEAFGQFMAVPQ